MNARIRTLIADDEPHSLGVLREHAARDLDLDVVAECRDGASAVAATRDLAPELLLLDVNMPLMDGFEVLNHVSLDPAPAVVFVTAYDNYAVRAFAAEAVDYLLKPFGADRFRQAVERGKQRVYLQRAAGDDTVERSVARSGAGSGADERPHLSRLLVKDGPRIVALPTETIDWVESAANYLRIHAGGSSYFMRMKISDMEELLDASVFARVHRTRIVNMARVVALAPVSTGTYVLTLHDGTELRMSRMHSSAVLRAFYLGSDRLLR